MERIVKETLGEGFLQSMRSMLPEHMHAGLLHYLVLGMPPGSFLQAVLENRLSRAVAKADEINRTKLIEWAHFMVMHMPMVAWGDAETVAKWIKSGGLAGNRGDGEKP